MTVYNAKTIFIDTNDSHRLVRYDIIKKNEYTAFVKVTDTDETIDELPVPTIEIDQLIITKEQYEGHYDLDKPWVVRREQADNFDGYVLYRCEQHRKKIDKSIVFK